MTYDFIVIGGGSAGCVLANRLSARGDKVLLLEAGPDTPPESIRPEILDLYAGSASYRPEWHWKGLKASYLASRHFPAEPPVERTYEQPRIMGGGSSINGMMALRGLPSDFEEWRMLGAEGWGYPDVLPYFRRLERDFDFNNQFHGEAGPIPIGRISREKWPPFEQAAGRALEATSYRELADSNAESSDGFFSFGLTAAYGHRVSAAMAYLTPAVRRRSQLDIRANVTVLRILFAGNRAVGVQARGPDGDLTFTGNTVVVSAGAIHSPAVLLRSGIGPAEEIRRVGIPVIANVPGVGRNLQDHPMVGICGHLRSPARMTRRWRRHNHLGWRFSSGLPDCPAGDMQGTFYSNSGTHPLGYSLATLFVQINRSYSCGQVSLQSNDPLVEPRVVFDYFSDERDLTRLVGALRLAHQLMTSKELSGCIDKVFFASLSDSAKRLQFPSYRNLAVSRVLAGLLDMGEWARNATLSQIVGDSYNPHRLLESDATIGRWVSKNSCSPWHLAGTCRIGSTADPDAVVDPKCRVRGVDGLRVADASVMPTVVSANTNITTIMIAEKASDQILNDQIGK